MNNVVIEVKELVRRFGNITALDGLSFQVMKGEIFGFVGPNGAGKTTTIRVLLGLCHLEQGSAHIFGCNVRNNFSSVGPRIGFVLESYGFYEDLTGMENLDYHGRLFTLSSKQRVERVNTLLEAVGLQDRSRDLVKKYSKGMKQRLAVALALINNPDLLLLDEPFDGIDTETHRDLRELIVSLSKKEGKSIFFTSHDLADVEKLATRVAIIYKGRLVTCDSVDALQKQIRQNTIKIVFAEPVTDEIIMRALKPLGLSGSLNQNGKQISISLIEDITADMVINRLVTSQLSICEVVPVKSSLEEVYFAMLSTDEVGPRSENIKKRSSD